MQRIQLSQDRCTGCRLCETVCSLSHEGRMNLSVSRIQIHPLSELAYHPRVCLQCRDCPPSDVCPSDAFQRDAETGVVHVLEEACDGCGACVLACPFSAVVDDNGRILVCDVCEGNPRCVTVCQKEAIRFGPD